MRQWVFSFYESDHGLVETSRQRTYIQELRVGEHALFQTRSEKINVILHQFVDRPLVRAGSVALCDLGGFEPGHERRPIGLDDFRSAKIQ